MPRIETNDFPITNLNALSSRYRLYRIKGLNRNHSEYYVNRQHIIRKLSFWLKKPVTVIERDGTPHLVVRNDAPDISSPMSLVRVPVYFEPVGESFELDYTVRSPENDGICIRFLQFMLQEPLHTRPELWQPKAGDAFFKKTFVHSTNEIAHHVGFAIRVVPAADAGLALRVHVANKYVGRQPLPPRIRRDDFEHWRKRHYIYHFGHQWYEIRADLLSDMNVMEYPIPVDGSWIPLLEYVLKQCQKPIPPELALVPNDASVINYLDNRKDERGVPASLWQSLSSAARVTPSLSRLTCCVPAVPRTESTVSLPNLKSGTLNIRAGTVIGRVSTLSVVLPERKASQILSNKVECLSQYIGCARTSVGVSG